MVRKAEQITAEIDEYNKILIDCLSREGGIYAVDLLYIAQKVSDLKQELRIAEAMR